MAKRQIKEVFVTSEEQCPFCRRKLEYSKVNCRASYLDGGLNSRERQVKQRLKHCQRCDVWFKHPDTFSGNEPGKTTEEGVFFPEQKAWKTPQGIICCETLGRQTREEAHRLCYGKEAENRTVAVEDVRPAIRKNVRTQKENPSLLAEIISKYGAPASTISVIAYHEEGQKEKKRLFLVGRFEDQAPEKQWWHISRGASQRILMAIAEGRWTFFLREEDETACRIDYYFVGIEMEEQISAFKKLLTADFSEDLFVNVKLFNFKNICCRHSESVQVVRVKIAGFRQKEAAPLEVYYCRECGEFFINRDRYLRFCAHNGIPPFRLYSDTADLWSYSDSYLPGGLNEQSILNLYGYNVQSREAESVRKRRMRLEDLIDSGLVSKARVLNHLEFLLTLNRGNRQRYRACAAWQSDLDYIEKHNAESEQLFIGEVSW